MMVGHRQLLARQALGVWLVGTWLYAMQWLVSAEVWGDYSGAIFLGVLVSSHHNQGGVLVLAACLSILLHRCCMSMALLASAS